jgi:hypothetical protein
MDSAFGRDYFTLDSRFPSSLRATTRQKSPPYKNEIAALRPAGQDFARNDKGHF